MPASIFLILCAAALALAGCSDGSSPAETPSTDGAVGSDAAAPDAAVQDAAAQDAATPDAAAQDAAAPDAAVQDAAAPDAAAPDAATPDAAAADAAAPDAAVPDAAVVMVDAGGMDADLPDASPDAGPMVQVISPDEAEVPENMIGLVYQAEADRVGATFAIAGGVDAALFAVDPLTGAVTLAEPLNFEQPTDADEDGVYEVALQATWEAEISAPQTVALRVTDVNDPPEWLSEAAAVAPENDVALVFEALARDEDEDVLRFSLEGGADADLFSVDPATGMPSFLVAPDFEAPADADGDNVYLLTVGVDDDAGGQDTLDLAVTVVDVDEAPVFATAAVFLVPENEPDVGAIRATDPEGLAVRHAIVGGDDAAAFVLEPDTGALRWTVPANFEVPTDLDADGVYRLEVEASDGVVAAVQAIEVTVFDVNDAPECVPVDVRVELDENAVGAFARMAAVDEDGDALTPAVIDADDGALFEITAEGDVSFRAPPDFEAPLDGDADNVYTVRTAFSDPEGARCEGTVTVEVMDLGLAVGFTYPVHTANLFGAATVDVVGHLRDEDDGVVERAEIDTLTLNGEPVTVDPVDPRIWRHQIEVEAGALLNLEAVITGTTGLVHRRIIEVENRRSLINTTLIALDEAGERLYVFEDDLQALSVMDLQTGAVSLVSGAARGDGPEIRYPTAMGVYDGDVYLAIGQPNLLFAVDPATGARRLVSGLARGAGPVTELTTILRGFGLNRAAGEVYLVSVNDDAVLSINLETGDRRAVSSGRTGAGPRFINPRTLGYAEGDDTLYVSAEGLDAIVAVDLATGDRAVAVDLGRGSPSQRAGFFGTVVSMCVDPARPLVFGLSGSSSDFFAFNVADDSVSARAPRVVSVADAACDFDADQVLLADRRSRTISQVDLSTEERVTLSQPPLLAAPPFVLKALAPDTGALWGTAANPERLFLDPDADALLQAEAWDFEGDVDAIAVSGDAQRLFVLDGRAAQVVAYAVTDGAAEVLTSADVGAGPVLEAPEGLAIDAARGRLYTVDTDLQALIAIDLATGDRRVVSDADVGVGPVWTRVRSLAFEARSGRLFVSARSDEAGDATGEIFEVDLDTGDRTLVVDPTAGGELPRFNGAMVVDALRNRLIWTDHLGTQTYMLDLASMERRAVWPADPARPLSNLRVQTPLHDPQTGRLYMAWSDGQAVFIVNPDTGARALIGR